jgi:hypothetical protein
MARKRRLPYDCFACGKRFRNAQGVRAHRRTCRYPRLKRQGEAQAAASAWDRHSSWKTTGAAQPGG